MALSASDDISHGAGAEGGEIFMKLRSDWVQLDLMVLIPNITSSWFTESDAKAVGLSNLH